MYIPNTPIIARHWWGTGNGLSLVDEEFLEYVTRKFRDSGIPGHKVCIEITETAAIANLDSAIQLINSLKGLGCKFSLDVLR